VRLLRDRDEVARLDDLVGVDDARAHHVRAVGDERHRAGVDGDDAALGFVDVRAAHRQKRLVVDVQYGGLAVDEHEVELGAGELDELVRVRVDVHAEGVRERRLQLANLVAPKVVTGFDLHTRT
jgi:hypothetical protein